MRRYARIVAGILGLVLLTSTDGYGWGKRGHYLISEIAFHYLEADTKTKLLALLEGMSIEQAGDWMDEIRGDSRYDSLKPCHFFDTPSGQEVVLVPGDNLLALLDRTLKEVGNPSGLNAGQLKDRLLYLFHLVGDLHQPLHLGYPEDKGGNLEQVSFFGRGSNLHRVWDSDILEYKQVSLQDCLGIASFSAQDINRLQQLDILGWAKETHSLLDQVYAFSGHKVEQDYTDRETPVIERQLLLAGIRLAAVLQYFIHNAPTGTTTPGIQFSTPLIQVADSIPRIGIQEVTAYVGKTVRVCSKVFSARYLQTAASKPTFLNLGGDHPNELLTLVIWEDKRKDFTNPPELFYPGRQICVTGKITLYRGKPEIIVSRQSEIELQ